jgi:hypothetical protein
VFAGDFSATRATGGDFAIEIELDTPFRWDPSSGPLVVDVRKLADLGGGGTFDLDAVDGSTELSSVVHTSDANAANANQPVAARAPVLRLGGTIGGNALTTPYGTGCGPSTGAPIAGTIGLPWLGNRDFHFAVFDAAPQAAALLVLGAGVSSYPLDFLSLPGCTLLTDATLGNLLAATDPDGQATSPAGLPEVPALVGFSVTTQWVVLDPLGVNGIALSNGLRIEAQ